MKTMKRIAALLLLVAVAVGCAGCGKTDDGTMSLEEGTEKYLSVRKIGDDRLISLGMTREEVEKVAGEPIEQWANYDMWAYSGGLVIEYNETSTVYFLRLVEPEGKAAEYETPKGLRVGDSLGKAQEAYNNHFIDMDGYRYNVLMKTAEKKWKL